MAIASLVCSLLGLSLVGVILGHLAMGQIKRTGEGGHGLALAGTIIGYVSLAIVLVVLALWFFAAVSVFAFMDAVPTSGVTSWGVTSSPVPAP